MPALYRRNGTNLPAKYLPLIAKRIVVLLFALCAAGAFRQSDAASPPASAFVQSMANDVIVIIRKSDANQQQRRAELRVVFLKAFDTQSIARFVLGVHWRTANDAQKAEYLRIFPDYVANIYADQFATYTGETFSVLMERPINENDSVVKARILRPRAESIAVEFRVRRENAEFRIVDVVVEGVSLLVAKRDEFSSVIRREGIDMLLTRMKRLIESLSRSGAK